MGSGCGSVGSGYSGVGSGCGGVGSGCSGCVAGADAKLRSLRPSEIKTSSYLRRVVINGLSFLKYLLVSFFFPTLPFLRNESGVKEIKNRTLKIKVLSTEFISATAVGLSSISSL